MTVVLAILLLCLQERTPRCDVIDRRIQQLGDEDARTRNLAEAEIEELFRDVAAAIDLLASAPKPAREDVLLRQERVRRDWQSALSIFVPRAASEGFAAVAPGVRDDVDSDNRKVRRLLMSARVTLELTNAPLTALAEFLREETGLDIHISELAAADDQVLTIHARNETPASILRRTLPPLGLAQQVTDGVLQILPAHLLRKPTKLELYDVLELVMDQAGEALIDRIVKEVRPDQWKQDEGRSIQFQNGLLIVRNTRPVHHALLDFLNRLRSGVPPEPRSQPPDWIVGTLRDLEGSQATLAEARLRALGRDAAYALYALSAAGRSEDLEVRLRTAALTQSLILSLGEEPCRAFLETEGLQRLVREIRELWTRDTDCDDFEAEARALFGPRASSVRLIMTATTGEALFTLPVQELLDRGAAVILSGRDQPRIFAPEQRLDPQGGGLVFTLPQDPDDRKMGRGPTLVVVELGR